MKTPLCRKLGCELPIFAFSHCRDVIVEVTKAGGFGVLGASTFSPDQLEAELRWIDQHVQGRPYGVDVLIPAAYDKAAEKSPEDLQQMIPQAHRDFMENILSEAGVAPLAADDLANLREELVNGRGSMTPDGARRLLRVALEHSQVKLVVSALGSPPPDVVLDLKARGVMVGAMCGKGEHAARHKAAGVELIVAQGTEAGGHTGDVATMVLVPQVVQAAGPDVFVLAAGGIAKGSQIVASLALGAQGVWCGTLWLATRESELDPFEKSVLFSARTEDAVRRKARTGKHVRMLKSRLSEAWEQEGAPPYLPTPLQGILYNEAHARVVRSKQKDLYSFPAGQVVGMLNEETTVRQVMVQLQEEYLETMGRLDQLAAESDHE
jgi:NAD(P)H-dependent flavin oxidoreductase YrpB (nitropropane dioxygenase family)